MSGDPEHIETFDPRDSVIDGIYHPDVEPEFRATEPWFKEEVDPWESPTFHAQAKWLARRRAETVADLARIESELEKCAQIKDSQKRNQAMVSALQQGRGAWAQLAHIQTLMLSINPIYSYQALSNYYLWRAEQLELFDTRLTDAQTRKPFYRVENPWNSMTSGSTFAKPASPSRHATTLSLRLSLRS